MQFSCFNSLQKNAHLQKCYCNEKVIFISGKKIQLAIFLQTKMRMLIQLKIRYWHSRISSTQFYLYKVNFSGLCKITVIWLQFAIALVSQRAMCLDKSPLKWKNTLYPKQSFVRCFNAEAICNFWTQFLVC